MIDLDTPQPWAGRHAAYIQHRQLFIIPDLDPYTRRAALPHGLDHAHYGDNLADDPVWGSAQTSGQHACTLPPRNARPRNTCTPRMPVP